MQELAVMGGLGALVVILAGADFAYFSGQENGRDAEVALQVPTQTNVSRQGDENCRYDPQKEAFPDYASLIGPQDPFGGNPDATVKVIEFFDPNCPHCKGVYRILKEVSQNSPGNATFIYKVFVIWPFSVPQSAALYAAAEEGKFFEMLDLQMENQSRGGLRPEQLRTLANGLGLDGDLMIQRIKAGQFMDRLQRVREQGQQVGLTGVPAVMINGRWLDGRSRTVDCVTQLIEEAAGETAVSTSEGDQSH
jgi:protein-disulfide isomerase